MQSFCCNTGRLRLRISATFSERCSHQQPLSTSSKASLTANTTISTQTNTSTSLPQLEADDTPLSRIPTSKLLRSFLFSRLFASPWAMKPGLAAMQMVANSSSKFLDPDKNLILKALIKPTVYKHFCAGVDESEIRATSAAIRKLGFSGISLCFAREIQLGHDKKMLGHEQGSFDVAEEEIRQWRDGLLQTLRMTSPGDWVAIKITGAGSNVMNKLMNNEQLPASFHEAMDKLCSQANEQNTRIVIDSEQQVVQKGIDTVAIDLMRKWNKSNKPLVYNTIQAYLKAAPSKVQHQLKLARKENWSLGIKLVRGAYIAVEQRGLIHDTKSDTDACYNSIVRDLLQGTVPGFKTFNEYPKFQLLLAGHNVESVHKACELATRLARTGDLKVHPEFAQLQGMADDLAFEVLSGGGVNGKEGETNIDNGNGSSYTPRVYKYLSWGTVKECMQYLVRRAIENQAAAERMKDGAEKYGKELRRRIAGSVGL